VNISSAVLDAPKTWNARYRCSAWRSSKSILVVAGAVMFRIRADPLRFSCSSIRFVSRK
jgi:hypothetical protein